MVTVTPHLQNAIGLQIVSKSDNSFTVLVAPESAVPIRRAALFKAPQGDVLVRVSEGEREIKISKPEAKPQTNGAPKDDDDGDDSDDEYDDEEDEVRERVWKPAKTLAEFALHGLEKNAIIEVMVNVSADLQASLTAREIGAKGGIRGSIDKPEVVENGAA